MIRILRIAIGAHSRSVAPPAQAGCDRPRPTAIAERRRIGQKPRPPVGAVVLIAVLTIALPVFGLILAGVVTGRLGGLGAAATEALNRFVVNLALPAVLFHAMAHIDPHDLAHPGLLAAFGLAVAVPFALTVAWVRLRGVSLGDSAIHAMCATFSNVGYMGIPLCRIAFGDASLVPGVITMVITACPQFAVAVMMLEAGRPGGTGGRAGWWAIGRRVGLALVRNPLLISPVIGLGVAMAGLPLPTALDRFLLLLGGAATPCALVATGLMLVQTAGRFRFRLVTGLVLVKLLVKPAIAWGIAFHLVDMPPAWAETAVIMAALPTGAGAFILARLYDREAAVTSGTILVSTIGSFVTLSVLLSWLT